MRSTISSMDTQLVLSEVQAEKELALVIEDNRGTRSSFPGFLSQTEYEYMFALRGNEDFLGSPAKKNPLLPWNGQSTRLQKIFQAKEVMKDLKDWYEQIFRVKDGLDDEDYAEREVFFNSNLIHFIAATDDNEDTVGHSQFVAGYTLLLTRELGIEDRSFLVDIERGALLHDIGKIGIPDSILKKKGPLTTIEKEIIKDHPLLGYKLIEGFYFLQRAAQVVLHHHEHFDGQGYPHGLAGEDIPLEARIFSLADTVDAITSDRPYRKGRSFEEARQEIERFSGSQFDPQIVDVFLSIPKERWQTAKLDTLRNLHLPSIH
jgi:putative nucleotidyltransferase with HDIG domain